MPPESAALPALLAARAVAATPALVPALGRPLGLGCLGWPVPLPAARPPEADGSAGAGRALVPWAAWAAWALTVLQLSQYQSPGGTVSSLGARQPMWNADVQPSQQSRSPPVWHTWQ